MRTYQSCIPVTYRDTLCFSDIVW